VKPNPALAPGIPGSRTDGTNATNNEMLQNHTQASTLRREAQWAGAAPATTVFTVKLRARR
jgi:hypothetical protein